MTLGERLEEARKRKGISLREAAEATKIRGDFLAALESNDSDIPLPAIYSRGFLKIYAKFLRLDVDKVMSDYDAHHRTRRLGRSGGGSSRPAPLGRIEVPVPKASSSSTATVPSEPKVESESKPVEGDEPGVDTGTAVRLVAIAILTIGMIAALWTVGRMFFGSEEAAAPATPPAAVAEPARPAAASDVQRATLVALDDVTILIDQIADGQRIYTGTLTRGERLPLEFRGALRIRFSEGRNLEIERGGQRLSPQRVGPGNLTLR